jgi:hypothetical protein
VPHINHPRLTVAACLLAPLVLMAGCQSPVYRPLPPAAPMVPAQLPASPTAPEPVVDPMPTAPATFRIKGLATRHGQAETVLAVTLHDLRKPNQTQEASVRIEADGQFEITLPDGTTNADLLVMTVATRSVRLHRLVTRTDWQSGTIEPLVVDEITSVTSKLLGPALVPLVTASGMDGDIQAAIRSVSEAVTRLPRSNDERVTRALRDLQTSPSDDALDHLTQTVMRHGSEQRLILATVQQAMATAAQRLTDKAIPAWEYAGLKVAIGSTLPVASSLLDEMKQAHTYFHNLPAPAVSGGGGGGGGSTAVPVDDVLFQGSVN